MGNIGTSREHLTDEKNSLARQPSSAIRSAGKSREIPRTTAEELPWGEDARTHKYCDGASADGRKSHIKLLGSARLCTTFSIHINFYSSSMQFQQHSRSR